MHLSSIRRIERRACSRYSKKKSIKLITRFIKKSLSTLYVYMRRTHLFPQTRNFISLQNYAFILEGNKNKRSLSLRLQAQSSASRGTLSSSVFPPFFSLSLSLSLSISLSVSSGTTCGNVLSHRPLPLTAAQIVSSSRAAKPRELLRAHTRVSHTHTHTHVCVVDTTVKKFARPRVLLLP